jgi:hypothetical protein
VVADRNADARSHGSEKLHNFPEERSLSYQDVEKQIDWGDDYNVVNESSVV